MSRFGPLVINDMREPCEGCASLIWPVSVVDGDGAVLRRTFSERMFKPVEHTPQRCREIRGKA